MTAVGRDVFIVDGITSVMGYGPMPAPRMALHKAIVPGIATVLERE